MRMAREASLSVPTTQAHLALLIFLQKIILIYKIGKAAPADCCHGSKMQF